MDKSEIDVSWDFAAIRFGQQRVRAIVAVVRMGVVTCEQCHEQFSLSHNPKFADASMAARQATWLEAKLASEHRRGVPHEDAMPLPSLPNEE